MKRQNTISDFFVVEKSRMKTSKGGPLGMGKFGFIAPELAQFAYAAITALIILFTWTGHEDPASLVWQRVTALSGTVALWIVYMLWPCRMVMACRIGYLLVMLGFWYPDTYEINKQIGSLDHIFAQWEQTIFNCQPALLFSQRFTSKVVSELMYMGYESYYLFFIILPCIALARYYDQLERITFILLGSFFTCYVIFILLPVTGPQYYYLAAGIDNIANGVFPNIGKYFADSTECLTAPGWQDGPFYHLCALLHGAGERPTAAFPSSHVAIATLVMAICTKMRMWRMLIILAIPYLFLCMATVYIRAHYAIDSITGFVSGIILFFVFGGMKLRS